MDDITIAVAMIERHVSALSGVSIEMTAKDLQNWTTAYKEDKGHIAAIFEATPEGESEDFYLTPSGLMARMVGGQQKIIVPKSLWQQIFKECHDVPFTSHVGMRKTLELMDRQFYW